MLKSNFLLFIIIFFSSVAFGQEQRLADSFEIIYKENKSGDTASLQMLLDMSFNEVRDNQKALEYAEELILISQQQGNKKFLRTGYYLKGTKLRLLGRLEEAMSAFIISAELAIQQKNSKAEGIAYNAIADIYSIANNHATASNYYNKAISILRKSNDSVSLAAALSNAGDDLLKVKSYDTALHYFTEAKRIYKAIDYPSGIGYSLGNIGVLYANTGNLNQAEKNIDSAIFILDANHDYYPICDFLLSIAEVYEGKGMTQKAIEYANKSLGLAQQYHLNEQVVNASKKLSAYYEKIGNSKESLRFYKMYFQYRDSLNNTVTIQKMADLRTGFEVSQKQAEVNLLIKQRRTQQNLLAAMVLIAFLGFCLAAILIKSNRNRKKANIILTHQKLQTDTEKIKAEKALLDLNKAQAQLIQSEKLASLGELTAGIAHEIQNPLNFVNNFSEVSKELLDEMEHALDKGNTKEVKEIMTEVISNLDKINHHGKRADEIVKGMLQHSRSSSGIKEPTDINALCNEYLRLSYQGLRAKDKSFNASMVEAFDKSIGNINMIPQEMGRVILNLLTNAFYEVNKKKKNGVEGYKPTVSISTNKIGKKITIKITDNGNGIAPNLIDKIFQPFFTTKPAGQGTGLGLSLSYDIVKAHGGEIKINSKQYEGTEFTIELPIA